MTRVHVENITVPAATIGSADRGAPAVDVPARLYRLANAESSGPAGTSRTGVVWAHGGGFVAGDLDMPEAHWVARRLATAGHVVLSVDYRLVGLDDPWSGVYQDQAANRFPAAHDDLHAALVWFAAQAGTWGVGPDRIVLGGASAGANLAAGVGLRLARNRGTVAVSGLMLAYPLLHRTLPEHPTTVAKAVASLPADKRFPPQIVAGLNLNYVGDHTALNDPRAFPGGHDLSGLPRTIIVNSERDDLRSSGELFARELAAADVEVDCTFEPGTVHGHLDTPELPYAERTLKTFLTWLAIAESAGAIPPQGGPDSRPAGASLSR